MSPTKKRTKWSLDAGIKNKSDLKTLHATNKKVLDHPEPVSKRISFGLPISKHEALAHHKSHPCSPDTHTQDSGKSNTRQQCQGEHTLPSSKSFLCFTIECDSSSSTEVPTIQTVRSVIKSILRSQEVLVIILPTFHDLAPIWSNRELPEKKNTRLMRPYIHQGRMLTASFSGKLLIGHPTQTDILPTISKALEGYPEVKIYHTKFGISKVINIGVLCEYSNRKAGRLCPTGLNVYCVHLLEATTLQLQQYGTQCMAMGTPTPLLGLSSLNAKLKTPLQFVQAFHLFMDQWQKLVIPYAQW